MNSLVCLFYVIFLILISFILECFVFFIVKFVVNLLMVGFFIKKEEEKIKY